jgi:hypothetical protein
MPLLENAHGPISDKQIYIGSRLMSAELFRTPDYLTVMTSDEQDQKNEHDNEERNSDDEVKSINDEDDNKELSQTDNTSKFGDAIIGKTSLYRDDNGKMELDIPTPSMADTPTTIKSSPKSESSPSTPRHPTSLKMGAWAYTCTCGKSFRRMCDLT